MEARRIFILDHVLHSHWQLLVIDVKEEVRSVTRDRQSILPAIVSPKTSRFAWKEDCRKT